MVDETSAVRLDLKGLRCPMPVVRLSQAVKTMAPGQAVEAFATDPGVMTDIPAWCRTTGNRLVLIEKQEQQYHFVVQRA